MKAESRMRLLAISLLMNKRRGEMEVFGAVCTDNPADANAMPGKNSLQKK